VVGYATHAHVEEVKVHHGRFHDLHLNAILAHAHPNERLKRSAWTLYCVRLEKLQEAHAIGSYLVEQAVPRMYRNLAQNPNIQARTFVHVLRLFFYRGPGLLRQFDLSDVFLSRKSNAVLARPEPRGRARYDMRPLEATLDELPQLFYAVAST
jgi:hypothetical protein